MSVTFSAYIISDSNQYTWMEPDLNISNSNFFSLMNLLGFEDPEYCGTFGDGSLQDLVERIQFILSSVILMPELDGGTPTQESVGERGCRIVELGLREGYYTDRLTVLLQICKLALEKGGAVSYG